MAAGMCEPEVRTAAERINVNHSIQEEYSNCVSAIRQLSDFIDTLESNKLSEAPERQKDQMKPFVVMLQELPGELSILAEAIHTQTNRLREMLT